MSSLFIWIYAFGGGREVHETFEGGGGQTINVWEPLDEFFASARDQTPVIQSYTD
jgi:hypothetical protein